jgi:hypothetical protein
MAMVVVVMVKDDDNANDDAGEDGKIHDHR